MPLGELFQQGEMQRGRRVDWGNAHQTADLEAAGGAAFEKPRQISGQYPAFLVFRPGIHLNQAWHGPALFFHFPGQLFGETGAVDGFDDVEERHGILGLVGLQRPDKVQADGGIGGLAGSPALGRLLHAVLPEDPLSGSEGRFDAVVRLDFADRHEGNAVRRAMRVPAGFFDGGANGGKIFGDGHSVFFIGFAAKRKGPVRDPFQFMTSNKN